MKLLLLSFIFARLAFAMRLEDGSLDLEPTSSNSTSEEEYLSCESNSSDDSESEHEVLATAVVVEDPEVQSRESKLLSIMEKSFVLAAGQGDIATIELVIDVKKLQPTFHSALIAALEHNHENIAMLIASHPSCCPTLNNFEAVELAVAKKMKLDLVLELLNSRNLGVENRTSANISGRTLSAKVTKAAELCARKGLPTVLAFLAQYYNKKKKNLSAEFDLTKLVDACLEGPAPLETLPIILSTKNRFVKGVPASYKLSLFQKRIISAHKENKKALRNYFIKRAILTFDFMVKKGDLTHDCIMSNFPLISVLQATVSMQYLTANCTGFNYLPNDIRRVILDQTIDIIVEEADKEAARKAIAASKIAKARKRNFLRRK